MSEYRPPEGMELWRDRPVPTTPWKLYDFDGPNVWGKSYYYVVMLGSVVWWRRFRGRYPTKLHIAKLIAAGLVWNMVYYQDKTILF